METTIVLTMAELKRVEVIQRVFRGEVTMAEAAMVLGVSERHSFRIKARITKEGGSRGRSWQSRPHLQAEAFRQD